jgi:hypothetical protein
MSQLILFEDLPIKFENCPEIKNIDNLPLIDVVKNMNKLNKILGKNDHFLPHEDYVIFKTGGQHFWRKQNEKLFGGNDYPFVMNKKTKKIVSFSLAGFYPTFVYQIEFGSMKVVTLLFHRLVASAFIENPLNSPLVDHIDGNPANYKHTNLRWMTHKENRGTDSAKKNRANFTKLEDKYHLVFDNIQSKLNDK